MAKPASVYCGCLAGFGRKTYITYCRLPVNLKPNQHRRLGCLDVGLTRRDMEKALDVAREAV